MGICVSVCMYTFAHHICVDTFGCMVELLVTRRANDQYLPCFTLNR